jgi:hypothetical protein
MKNQLGVSEVNAVMQERGITRKSAIRWLTKHTAKSASKLKATANLATAAVAPAQDVKMAAANDKPEVAPKASKPAICADLVTRAPFGGTGISARTLPNRQSQARTRPHKMTRRKSYKPL